MKLSKAFDSAGHKILIRKFKMDGIKGINLVWFCGYLTNRIQCISIKHDLETDIKNICCGVSINLILVPLLFLLYVKDLHNSPTFDPIMFPEDTNLFYEYKDLKTLSPLDNQELKKVNKWFETNKLSLSLNVGETKYFLFHKPSRKYNLPFLLPRLLIKKHKVKKG